MIDHLIAALNKEVDLSAEEIADTLWLAIHMEKSVTVVDSASRTSQESKLDSETTEDQSNQRSEQEISNNSEPKTLKSQPESTEEAQDESKEEPQEEKKAGLYNKKPDRSQKSLEIPFKVPDAPSLREQLDLARALRPLMRRIPSGSTLVLDEAATTQRIADEGIWLPILRPTLEPWLDLELVIDEGISMQIWRHTIKELERLLKNYGIFRDVRVWGLISNEQNKIQIRRGIGATAKNQPARSAAELIDSSGRRLILVVSDCVSDLWRNGDVNSALKTWSNNVPTAIIQMLPKWLWARTALGWATEVRFQGLAPAVSNRQLIANTVSLWSEIDEATGIKVPVFTLERDRVANWAQMLVGKGSIQSSGYVFKPEARNLERNKSFLNFSQGELTAEQRVQAFRVTASPMARKLAGLLSSAPVISLPVVRLIRETILQDSQQVHVAEVFLGGLLKPLSEIEVYTAPDYVQYGFIDGVRELLIDSVPSSYVLNVVEEVSKFVAKKVGLSLADFSAVLRNPDQISDRKVVEQVQPFAMVTAQILRSLGGEYVKVAEKLEPSSEFNPNQISKIDFGNHHTSSIKKTTITSKKVCLIGDFGVGKTSLISRFVEGRFSEKYLTTVGVQLSRKSVYLESLSKKMELIIWDIQGHNKFDAIIPSYLQGARGVIIVGDLTRPETIEHLHKHLDLFLSVNSQGLAMIALNKSDLVVENRLAKITKLYNLEHTQIINTYVTSAKTGEYVDVIFHQLAENFLSKII